MYGRALWAMPLDMALGTLVYVVAYRLRFEGPEFSLFVPGAMRTLPLVVGGQVIALAAAGLYTGRMYRWALRVVFASGIGTAAAAAIAMAWFGGAGVSRFAFAADLPLFWIAALGWRAVWSLRALARRTAAAEGNAAGMIDRAEPADSLAVSVTALFGYRELLRALVLKDLKLKYRGSLLGLLWSLMNPLLMSAVYTVAFTYILRIRTEAFVFYLLLGILAWTFFATSASMATGAIVENGGLTKSVFFPRAILPIATVLFNLAQYVLSIAVFLPAMLIYHHVTPAAPMLLFPVFLGLQVLFTIGVALMLATATAFFRDVRHLLEIALTVMFWLTPILYEMTLVPERLRLPILLSPISSYVVAYQQMFYYRVWPDPAVWIVATVYAMGAPLLGASLLLAFEDRFGELV